MRVVTTHKNTDFDALSSMIAATILCPDLVPVLPKPVNHNVKEFLAIHKDLLKLRTWKEVDPNAISQLMVVDTDVWQRLGVPDAVKCRSDLDIVLYDHHPANGDIIPSTEYREAVGATITLMIRQLKAANKPLTRIQSTLFLTGLYEDTGNLTFSSTTPEDAYAAGYLLENGAELNILNLLLRPAYGEKQKNTLFEMLKGAHRLKINGYNVSISKLEIDGFVENLAVVVHMFREILNVDAAFGLFMAKGNCIVIGRSNHEQINIGTIMRSMGGGGHPGAGSAMIKAKSSNAIEVWLQELIAGNQRSSIQISDLMSFPVFTVQDEAKMAEAAKILRQRGCTGMPVVNASEGLVGVLSRRDFHGRIKKEAQLNSPVKAFMSRDIVTIEPGKSPVNAARLMIKHDIGRLPVVENGKIIGILTRSDVMRYYYDLMPD
ncbi:MAG: CBS domain-containing protein [Deltaproteobacteria bacterium]|nr:CBS domain-containing protein [Deltaproteobacteria bacterium]